AAARRPRLQRRLPLLPHGEAEGGAAGARRFARLFISGGGAVPLPQGRLPHRRDADRLRRPPRRLVEGERAGGGAVAGGAAVPGGEGVLRAGLRRNARCVTGGQVFGATTWVTPGEGTWVTHVPSLHNQPPVAQRTPKEC